MSSTNRPQSNGQIERSHRNLITALKAFIDPTLSNWDEKVTDAVVAINSAKQSSTRVSPYEIVYGQTMELPHERLFPWPPVENQDDQKATSENVNEIRTTVRNRLIAKQEKLKVRINAHRRKPREYTPGDLILVTRKLRRVGVSTKFLPKYCGPFQVVRKQSPLSYLVEDVMVRRKKSMA